MIAQTVAVVGLGYVGLNVVAACVQRYERVIGFDVDLGRVEGLSSGESHVLDIAPEELRPLPSGNIRFTTEPDLLAEADVIVICVPTPLMHGSPDLSAVAAAARTVAGVYRTGALICLESTTHPGTTREMILPLLEAGGRRVGEDFNLAYSPERVNPGDEDSRLSNTAKVIGGITPACTDAAERFYQPIVRETVLVDSPETAELSKLIENTYRMVNIALVNELAQLARPLGLDIWSAINAAATKSFGFVPFYPGPGVGGHCIPVDTVYLNARFRQQGLIFQLGELAQQINGGMPGHVAERVLEMVADVESPTALLIGLTYKPNVPDVRDAPAFPIAERLRAAGVRVRYHDHFVPKVPEWLQDGHSADLENAVPNSDVVVLLQPHHDLDLGWIASNAKRMLDTRGVIQGRGVERL